MIYNPFFLLKKNNLIKVFTFFILIATTFTSKSYAQTGKDGALTISTSNTVVSRYTRFNTDVLAGSTTVTVTNINAFTKISNCGKFVFLLLVRQGSSLYSSLNIGYHSHF